MKPSPQKLAPDQDHYAEAPNGNRQQGITVRQATGAQCREHEEDRQELEEHQSIPLPPKLALPFLELLNDPGLPIDHWPVEH